ncbi:MAG TPA: CAP domain-containing protein [Kofleriaceae bacterium]|nr:CAP domain-containing protein [Kofleriaceae bacterium]
MAAPRFFATAAVVLAVALVWVSPAAATGESDAQGFPNWAERVIHEWMNRARADPAAELATCSGCGEKACYAPIAPLAYDNRLNRAARFHSDEMVKQGYFSHDSACNVISTISQLYPGACDGAASCACMGGTKSCAGPCTDFGTRVSLFGVSASAEIIAGAADPEQAFYQWLHESYPLAQCGYNPGNGHRYSILASTGGVGVGVTGSPVGDFSFGAGAIPARAPSGAHYPRQAATVEAWASWYDTVAPESAHVVVDGSCTPMALTRGSGGNGAWMARLTGVGSGCHRYFFLFKTSAGAEVTYPTTGSLGIGPSGCADWEDTRTAGMCGGVSSGSDLAGGGGDGGTDPDGGSGGGGGCGCRVGRARGDGPFALVIVIGVIGLARAIRRSRSNPCRR